MRVSTTQQHARLVQDLQSLRQRQVEGWDKIATGKRINQPAEAPGSAIEMLGIRQETDQLDQYLNTIATVYARLAKEDILLQSYTSSLQSIRDLILSANNPARGNGGLNTLAQELAQWRNRVIDTLNSQDAEGHYLFAGFATNTAPVKKTDAGYIFNNDNNQRLIRVSQSSRITENNTAFQLCFAIANERGGTFNCLTELDTLYELLKAPPADLSKQLTAHLIRIDQTRNQIGSLHTNLGTRMKILDNLRDNYKQIRLYYQEQVSRLGDLDYGTALTQLNQDKVAIEAASKGLSEVSRLTLFNYL